MKLLVPASLILAMGVAAGSPAVQANELEDVVTARSNARAGGPVSEYDRYLLDRYGALSGTGYYSKSRRAHRKSLRYGWKAPRY